MQRQIFPAINLIAPILATNTTQVVPAPFIEITSTPNETFIQTIYSLRGALNISFNNISTQDFSKYFYSEQFHLSKLKFYALSLNSLTLKVVELIISTLISKPNPELKLIVIDNLEDGSLRMLYGFILYLAHKGQLLTVAFIGSSISQFWHRMFHELHHPQMLANAISNEFLLLMKARFSDRNRYTLQLNDLENTLRQTQTDNLSLTMQLQCKTNEHYALASKSESVTLYAQELEKRILAREVTMLAQVKSLQEQIDQQNLVKTAAEAKEAVLVAQLKALQDQAKAQETEKQDLITVATEKEEKLEGELSRLKIRADLLDETIASIDEQFPALLPMNTVLRTVGPEDLLLLQSQPPRKKTSRTESKEEIGSEEKFHKRSDQRSQLEEKIKSQITDWMINGSLKSKLQPAIHQYIRQQLEIAEVIITNGNSFYHIPDGKAECIIHCLAFIICNIPRAPMPYQDHQCERKVLLQTLANAFQMIDILHKKFVTLGYNSNRTEINLKSEIQNIINQLLPISHPVVTAVTTSAVRQLQAYGLFNTSPSHSISLDSSSPTQDYKPDVVMPHL
jgi:hypothetical protein